MAYVRAERQVAVIGNIQIRGAGVVKNKPKKKQKIEQASENFTCAPGYWVSEIFCDDSQGSKSISIAKFLSIRPFNVRFRCTRMR